MRADDDPFEGGFGATEGPMSLVVRTADRYAMMRADDDPFDGAFGATEGPMSLVARTADRYAMMRADDETRTRNILLGRQRL
jgi:hypothetical protein